MPLKTQKGAHQLGAITPIEGESIVKGATLYIELLLILLSNRHSPLTQIIIGRILYGITPITIYRVASITQIVIGGILNCIAHIAI